MNLTIWANFYFVRNLTIRGTGKLETIVWCTEGSGFIFLNIDGLFIQNITFTHCGTDAGFGPLEPGHPEYVQQAALWFFNVANLFISQVILHNSTGYGLIDFLKLGNVSIVESMFVLNGAQTGGDILIYHDTIEKCVQNTSITITIESCTIVHGTGMFTIPPGLDVYIQSCLNVDVIVMDSYFFNNTFKGNTLRRTSGNLGFRIDVSSKPCSITVQNCFIDWGIPNGMNLLFLGIDPLNCSIPCFSEDTSASNTVHVVNTTFTNNRCFINQFCPGGGMAITFTEGLCRATHIHLKDTIFVENYDSGITATDLQIEGTRVANIIKIEDSKIINSVGAVGAGISLKVWSAPPVNRIASQRSESVPLRLEITGTSFVGNKAVWNGGGIHAFTSDKAEMVILDSTFLHNTAVMGAAISLTRFGNHPSANCTITFKNVHFLYHVPSSVFGSVISAFNWDVQFHNCSFSHNSGTGVSASASRLFFLGSTTFQNNTGENGGALSLCLDSTIFLHPNTDVYFLGNHANSAGGGIYLQQDCIPNQISCFFQPVRPYYMPLSSTPELNISMHFANNTAGRAGDALYGGHVDICTWTKQSIAYDDVYQPHQLAGFFVSFKGFNNFDSALNSSEFHEFALGFGIFDLFFHLENQPGLSPISSDPIGVCLCAADSQLECNRTNEVISVYPGANFNVTAVVVGQRIGVVPGVVIANLKDPDVITVSRIVELQGSQSVGKECTQLNYTIFSQRPFEVLSLTAAKHTHLPMPWNHPPRTLNILLLSCPAGFTLSNNTGACECTQKLKERNITCNINSQMVLRPKPLWIGYSNTTPTTEGVLVHSHCPFDYCKPVDLYIALHNPNMQCAFNHIGILCGSCQPHLSLSLGTSMCKQCTDKFVAVVFPFALSGLALVFVLTLLNLTVSEGTLNGLILYANILHSNQIIFGYSSAATVFIAWINLDLGIETCFFDGMDAYAKTWLQFVFPLYIWAIVIMVIVLSHYYIFAAKLFRRHAVKVLATLFLLSYAKIQRATISALSFTTLTYPDGHDRAVWLPDGNIPYLQGKHIPLFIAGVATLVILSIPYSFLLLFTQCLQRKSGNTFLKWVVRMKPLFDAYSGPYKDKYRFWTGFILSCLNCLFLVFSFNSLGDPALNLLAISLVSILLLAVLLALHGVYKKWPTDVLEASFYTNLAVTASATFYAGQQNAGKQAIVGNLSVGIAFLEFIGIILYHIWKHTSLSTRLEQFKVCCRRNSPFHHQSPRDYSNDPDRCSSDESGGVELQPLVLEFDEYREPVLRYADSD